MIGAGSATLLPNLVFFCSLIHQHRKFVNEAELNPHRTPSA